MKLRIDEIIIDGRAHKIEYDTKYSNGWHYTVESIKVRAANYLQMVGKKNSPFKKDRDDYKAWREAKAIIHGAKVTAIQKVVDAINDINEGPLRIIPENIGEEEE